MAMKPPPKRPTGGLSKPAIVPAAKPMPKPGLNGKKPTGGIRAPTQTAGAQSGLGRLGKANAVANQRRMMDRRSPR